MHQHWSRGKLHTTVHHSDTLESLLNRSSNNLTWSGLVAIHDILKRQARQMLKRSMAGNDEKLVNSTDDKDIMNTIRGTYLAFFESSKAERGEFMLIPI